MKKISLWLIFTFMSLKPLLAQLPDLECVNLRGHHGVSIKDRIFVYFDKNPDFFQFSFYSKQQDGELVLQNSYDCKLNKKDKGFLVSRQIFSCHDQSLALTQQKFEVTFHERFPTLIIPFQYQSKTQKIKFPCVNYPL